jgi:hypothetical protein
VPYRWLPTAFTQIAAAGVEPHEVMQALADRYRTEPWIHPTGLRCVAVWGTTLAGRRLIVVLKDEDNFDAAIVGAWEA